MRNTNKYAAVVKRLLVPDGLFLLHTIGYGVTEISIDPWMRKYIFPVAMIPSVAQIGADVEGMFVMEDCHNFSADYDITLMALFENFDAVLDLLKHKYPERFCRMWKYYLLACAGTFRARRAALADSAFSRRGARRLPEAFVPGS